jgi:molecular chaperone DnaJ
VNGPEGGTHYETLGVARTASSAEIRDAYRRLARQHHPDSAAGRDVGAMTTINEAYRVLGDPARRAAYDAGMRGTATVAAAPAPARTGSRPVVVPEPLPPARFPWKLALVMAAVGATVVLVGAALYEPAADPLPDNVLRPGSCVTIEGNGDAREVNCTGSGEELVVVTLVTGDEPCPEGLPAYRDRQGMGMACVRSDG